MERFIRETQQHNQSAVDVLPSLVREYQSLLRLQNQLFDQAVENDNQRLHLSQQQFSLIELKSQSFAQHVNSALSLITTSASDEFEKLHSSLENQIHQTIRIHTYTEELQRASEVAFIRHNEELTTLNRRSAQLEQHNESSNQTLRGLRSELSVAQRSITSLQKQAKTSAKQAKEAKQHADRLTKQHRQAALTEFKAFTSELEGKLTLLRDKKVLREMAESVIHSNEGGRPPTPRGPANIPIGGESHDGDIDNPNLSDDSGYSLPPDFAPGGQPPPPPRAPNMGANPSSNLSDDEDEHSAKSINYVRRQRRPEVRQTRQPREEAVTPRGAVREHYIKKVPMKAPDRFKGDSSEDFEMWWFQVDEYLNYHSEQFADQRDKITWMASILSDKALAWYRNRGIDLRHRRQEDTWEAFVSALASRFTDKAIAS